MLAVSPAVAHLLVAGQAAGEDPRDTLRSALDAAARSEAGTGARSCAADNLRRLLAECPAPSAALDAVARTSGHPAATGLLLAELLARGICPAGQLLAAVGAEALAGAVADLHAAATLGTLPGPAAARARLAFAALGKLLVTTAAGSGGIAGHVGAAGQAQPRHAAEDQRATKHAAQQTLDCLRARWAGGASSGSSAAGRHPPAPSVGQQAQQQLEGLSLLAALVAVVDREVFPRGCATSWLEAELGHALLAQPPAGTAAAAPASEDVGAALAAAWAAAMEAFASALPTESLLQQLHGPVWQGALAPAAAPRAAALLAAAARQRPRDRPAIERWVLEQAAAGVGQHAAGPVRCLLLLQRELVLALDGSSPGGPQRAQQVAQQQQQGSAWFPAQLRQGLQGRGPSPEQRYSAWLADAVLEPAPGGQQQQQQYQQQQQPQQQHLPFLVQQVLIPLLPDDPPRWLSAQQGPLQLLLSAASQARPGAPSLAPASRAAVEEYLGAAGQRLRAARDAEAQQGRSRGEAAAAGPGAPLSNLQRGQQRMEELLKEFASRGGRLTEKTLRELRDQASNVFTSGALTNQLAPALKACVPDPAAAQQRAALMEHLHAELDALKPFFKPDEVLRYRRHCLQAQLDSANLEQLSALAPTLLLPPAAGPGAGPGAAAGGLGGTRAAAPGGISPHQLLDRVGRLVGEHLQEWQQAQQQPGAQQAGPPSLGSLQQAASAVQGPEQLAAALLRMWEAAYAAASRSAAGPSHASGSSGGGRAAALGAPSLPAVAAHLLGIAHTHPLLHGPLLRGLQRQLAGEAVAEQQEGGSPRAGSRLEAAAVLATMAGALLASPAQRLGSATGGMQQQVQQVGGSGDGLRALFLWRLPARPAAASSGPAAAAGQAEGAPAVPGPLWLQHMLLSLPLGSAVAMARAAQVAAVHLGCLRHFRSFALLGATQSSQAEGSSGAVESSTLLLRTCQPAAGLALAAGAYGGELAASLAFPACTAALRLHQWLLMRLLVARQLLGWQAEEEEGGWEGAAGFDADASGSRPAKRQRGEQPEDWEQHEGAPSLEAVARLCSGTLQSHLVAPLAEAAGRLPLSEFLRLEAAAAEGGRGPSLLPPGTSDAVLRLCCELFLGVELAAEEEAAGGPGQGPAGQEAALASLFEPLAAAYPDSMRGGSGARQLQPSAQGSGWEERVPDSQGEAGEQEAGEEGQRAAALPAGPAVQALAAAAAAALVGSCGAGDGGSSSSGSSRGSSSSRGSEASLSVCQRACAHALRVLAGRSGIGHGPVALLPVLLSALVQACQKEMAAEAGPAGSLVGLPAGQLQGRQHPPAALRYADRQQAEAVGQGLAGLAQGLFLDLLPLPAAGKGMGSQGRARLTAVAAAVRYEIGAGPGGSAGAGTGLEQRLAAALEL